MTFYEVQGWFIGGEKRAFYFTTQAAAMNLFDSYKRLDGIFRVAVDRCKVPSGLISVTVSDLRECGSPGVDGPPNLRDVIASRCRLADVTLTVTAA